MNYVMGGACLLWDISLGTDYDIHNPCRRSLIFGWLQSSMIWGTHLGTPCNTFSIARDHGPGPPRLRSNDHPLGLPNISSPGALQEIEDGNLYMRFSATILRLCSSVNMKGTLENTSSSRVLISPPTLAISRLKQAQREICEFCMIASTWVVYTILSRSSSSLCWSVRLESGFFL